MCAAQVARMAPTAKRAPSAYGERVSSDHESAQQAEGRRRVIRRAPASEDNSDQPGGAELLEGLEQPRGH